jgi:hypothetical protein
MADHELDTAAAAEASVYEAFSSMDLDLMAAVWRDDELTVCIHPGRGLRRGKAAVIQSWMEIFTGSVPSSVEYRLIESIATEDLAVLLAEEGIRPRDRAPIANLPTRRNDPCSGSSSPLLLSS